jgi:GH24 family phage-related lysozyme (muramidase)
VADQDVIQALMQVLPGFEGNVPHLYLDTAGLVTVGIGHMIPNLSWAQQIPFVARSTGATASADEIQADYQAVATAVKGLLPSAYRHITSLNLPDGWAVQEASQRLQGEYLPPLKNQYPDYDTYPQTVQEALLDMIYNLGAAGLAEFVHFKAAVAAGQWRVAAQHCHRNRIQQGRNDWAAKQFLKAAA